MISITSSTKRDRLNILLRIGVTLGREVLLRIMGNHYYGDMHANDNSRLVLGVVNYYGNQERLRHVPGALIDAHGLDYMACHS